MLKKYLTCCIIKLLTNIQGGTDILLLFSRAVDCPLPQLL